MYSSPRLGTKAPRKLSLPSPYRRGLPLQQQQGAIAALASTGILSHSTITKTDSVVSGPYGKAIEPANEELEKAIADLNSLTDEINRFAHSQASSNDWTNLKRRKLLCEQTTTSKTTNDATVEEATIESSVLLIQDLLLETRQKCAQIVDNNVEWATKCDTELFSCKKQLSQITSDLAYTSRCVSDFETNLMVTGSAPESEQDAQTIEQAKEMEIYALREENGRLRLQLNALRRDFLERETPAAVAGESPAVVANLTAKLEQLQQEFEGSKHSLIALKEDRKRLRAEKIELLSQLKQVYATLEGKEKELRDFIRQYEQKMNESGKGVKELLLEKEHDEQIKATLQLQLRESRDEFLQLKGDLKTKDSECFSLQQQLKELQARFLFLTGQQPTTPSVGYVSMPVSPMTMEGTNQKPDRGSSTTSESDVRMDTCLSKARSSSCKRELSVSGDLVSHSFNNVQLVSSSVADENIAAKKTRCRREFSSQERTSRLSKFLGFGGCSGSSSGNKLVKKDTTHSLKVLDNENCSIATDLSLAEKAEQLLEARNIPLQQWKQCHVLAWLELELGLQAYSKAFLENIKSGRALMCLSDSEVEATLKIVQPMHKRKLRLAIEDYRTPALCKYPHAREVTYQYVCSHFLFAIGLPQYVDVFKTHLIDGRVLNQLNKKQLEKHFNITKKHQQISILRGTDLLRKFEFDTKSIANRRSKCEKTNSDLLVWTNARLLKWIKSIDLQEYADRLQESGIHGALAVLDPSFTSDTLADVLGIGSKQYMVRKHLASEFNCLLLDARANCRRAEQVPKRSMSKSIECNGGDGVQDGLEDSGSLGRNFSRSMTTSVVEQDYTATTGCGQDSDRSCASSRKRPSFRGSFGRVFGLKNRRNAEDTFSPSRKSQTEKAIINGSDVGYVDRRGCASNDLPPRVPLSPSTGKESATRSPASCKLLRSVTCGAVASDNATPRRANAGDLLSFERSEHLRTILGCQPQVLQQPPVTANFSSSSLEAANKRSSSLFNSNEKRCNSNTAAAAAAPVTVSSAKSTLESSSAGASGTRDSRASNQSSSGGSEHSHDSTSADSAVFSMSGSFCRSNNGQCSGGAASLLSASYHSGVSLCPNSSPAALPQFDHSLLGSCKSEKPRPACGVGASKLRKFAGVLMRDKTPRSPGAPSPGRPHSIAEWSPSHGILNATASSSLSYANRSAASPSATNCTSFFQPSSVHNNTAAIASSSPQFRTELLQHWLSLEDFKQRQGSPTMCAHAVATSSSPPVPAVTPPMKPERKILTICESEMEVEGSGCDRLNNNNTTSAANNSANQMRSPMRHVTSFDVGSQSPGKKQRPNSLPICVKQPPPSHSIVSFDIDSNNDIIKIDLIETDL